MRCSYLIDPSDLDYHIETEIADEQRVTRLDKHVAVQLLKLMSIGCPANGANVIPLTWVLESIELDCSSSTA